MVLLTLKIGHLHVLVDNYSCNFDIMSHMQAGRDLRFISLSMTGCLCGGALILLVTTFLDLLGYI